jgi:hypothetical protein
MNGLRRTLLVIYSLTLIAAAGGLIALAWNQERKLDLNVGEFNLQAFVTSTSNAKYGVTAALGAIALLGFITLVIAVLRDSKGARGTLRMRQADGGSVEVTAAAIESLLREELQQLPEVRTVNPRVRLGSGGAVETFIDASIEPSANIAQVTNDLSQGVANVLRTQVGVTNVKRPAIKISYDDLNVRGIPPRQAAPRPPRPAAAGPSEFDTAPVGQRPEPLASEPPMHDDPPAHD